MRIKNLVEMIKHNGLLTSMAQLEKLYRIAIENEEKLAESEARCAALAAENAGLKAKGRELLGEACAVYEKLNKMIDPAIGDFIDGQTLHEFQFVLDCETPATDAFLAEVRAQGVERYAEQLTSEAERAEETGWDGAAKFLRSESEKVREFAAQLRKGVQS
ncbi:hypothetical protein [Enterobacter hormaechei]|uniref:hypothetical protein n=1 Tax=Enterobacter hormaechei TaxID=158836 RepID=UPI003F42A45B